MSKDDFWQLVIEASYYLEHRMYGAYRATLDKISKLKGDG